ncbi:hypothetical protein PWT90_02396 [Aphanocladium album]|nr:hypothetical protein PWT90_02396 [Aphanocladium album]
MCDIPDFQLFSLHPTSNKTTTIVKTNQMVSQAPFGYMYFLITTKQMSRERKGIINFGRELDNDVIYQQTGHNRYICLFTLTNNGDLVFIDASGLKNRPQTALVITSTSTVVAAGSKPQPIDKYSMSMDPGSGGYAQQRRIIPMCDGLDIRVEIGRGCSWNFKWCAPLGSPDAIARTRSLLRRIYAAASQRYYVEDPHDRASTATAQQTPALHMRQPPETHWYGSLWREVPGKMYEAMDLKTGRLYAVKRLMGPRDDDAATQAWKRLAKLQAINFDTLDHPNIQATQFIDGWAVSHAALDLYHHLYPGNSRDLLTSIRASTIRVPSFAAQTQSDVRKITTWFAAQLLSALCYLDRHCVVHGNIKPENVLYQNISHHPPGNYLPQGMVRFFLVDFAFGEAGTQIGTAGYMAPETVKYHTRSGKTDLYALGVTMLELLGLLEVGEFSEGPEYWCGKLQRLTTRPVELSEGESWQYGHNQTQALCEYASLSTAMEGILRLQSDKRQDIQGAMQAFSELGEDALRFGSSTT